MAKITKEWIDPYFEYGVDVTNRCIFLSNDIDDDTSNQIIKGLYLMDNHSQASPIKMIISSYGGSLYDMFGLHDVITTIKSPVYTVGIGKVMSASVLLLACGKKRYASPNTSFMVHMPSWSGNEQSMNDHRIDLKEAQRLWDLWYASMDEYSNKDKSFWRRVCSKKEDFYFDANKAQELGIIDSLWEG